MPDAVKDCHVAFARETGGKETATPDEYACKELPDLL